MKRPAEQTDDSQPLASRPKLDNCTPSLGTTATQGTGSATQGTGSATQGTGSATQGTGSATQGTGSTSGSSSAATTMVPKIIYSGQRWDQDTTYRKMFEQYAPSVITRLFPKFLQPSKKVFVTMDTNVFIHCDLEDLKDELLKKFGKSLQVVIPNAVLQELDVMKKTAYYSVATQKKAFAADALLNQWLIEKNSFVTSQPKADDAKIGDFCFGINVKKNDDRVIVSCLQTRQKHPDGRVFIFTHDKNLQSKTIINQIDAVLSMLEANDGSTILTPATPSATSPSLDLTNKERGIIGAFIRVAEHGKLLRNRIHKILTATPVQQQVDERRFWVSLLGILSDSTSAFRQQLQRVMAPGGGLAEAEALRKIFEYFSIVFNIKLEPVTATDLLRVLTTQEELLKNEVDKRIKKIEKIFSSIQDCQLLLSPEESARIS